MGISASAAARSLSHSITFAVNLAVTTNLAQYLINKSSGRQGSFWKRHGPVILALVAIPLIMADPTRHVLQDAELIGGAMYRPGCHPNHGLHGLLCLTVVGWLITVLCTYVGFALLLGGVLWAADMPAKLRLAWAATRTSAADATAAQGSGAGPSVAPGGLQSDVDGSRELLLDREGDEDGQDPEVGLEP